MSGKSRHDKGKHPHHSKRSRAKQRYGAVASQQPTLADTPAPMAAISKPPPVSRPASPAAAKVVRYPYIATELRRIGILAGIVIIILIVLALVLS